MNKFESDWLALREPVDHASRNRQILNSVCSYLSEFESPRILDIACGTGSTARAFASLGLQTAKWCLADNDRELLDRARQMAPVGKIRFEVVDISKSLEIVDVFQPDLVVTSAFLDLVSMDWIQTFATKLKTADIPFYGALTYDGRAEPFPEIDGDAEIVAAVNKHQTTDKGFGSALGPAAPVVVEEKFRSRGYEILAGQSDWELKPMHDALLAELFRGWHMAACEIAPKQVVTFNTWLEARMELLQNTSGDETIARVGHQDIFACPA